MADQSNPEQRAHARLSASGAKRWMTCPGSPLLIDQLPEFHKRSSGFAKLGTAAHSLGEVCLRTGLQPRDYMGKWLDLEGGVHDGDPGDVEAYEVDDDMADAVQVYVDTVAAEMDRLGSCAELSVERRFDLSWLRPDMFGTNDASISLFLEELVVIDYKHGQGVPVEVSGYDDVAQAHYPNPQLAYYGLGGAHAYDFTHATVTLIVVQPRCPHPDGPVRRYEMTMAELLAFRDELADAADRVREAEDQIDAMPTRAWEDAYLKAGEHCKDTFCPKLGTPCPKALRMVQEVAQMDFADDPEPLPGPTSETTPAELGRVLEWIPFLDGFSKANKAHGQRLLEAGEDVPGQKLVRSRANRKFTASEPAIKAELAGAGFTPGQYLTEPKLKSPAQVEKLGKKAKLLVNGTRNPDYDPEVEGSREWLSPPLATKGLGKVTMAPTSDPREAVSFDPAADFIDEPEAWGDED